MNNIADLDWILTADIDVSAWKGNNMPAFTFKRCTMDHVSPFYYAVSGDNNRLIGFVWRVGTRWVGDDGTSWGFISDGKTRQECTENLYRQVALAWAR